MIIAIDYDETWTQDPAAWADVANVFSARGHRVLLVSARATGRQEVEILTAHCVARVIFADRMKTKRETCERLGEAVDVWCDDKPEMVDRVR